MTTLHPTVTDKDRPVTLIGDGKWRPLTIRDRDGKIKLAVRPDLPGVYLVEVALLGPWARVTRPASNLGVHLLRVPVLVPVWPSTPGKLPAGADDTAWSTLEIMDPPTEATWADTFSGKVVFAENPTSSSVAKAVGICYRYRGPGLVCTQRIIKFLRQAER